MGSLDTKLNAYVRLDGQGRVVAGSLILRRKQPKVGKWILVQTYQCCNPTTTTTSTTTGLTTTSTTTTNAPPASSCAVLGRAANFVILAASTVTNTGDTIVTGDLGLYAGTSVTGFPPGSIIGTQHITDATAANAQTDAQAAYDCLSLLRVTHTLDRYDLGEETLDPGIYSVSSSLAITGTLILNGGGNPDAVFIFKVPTTFIPTGYATVTLINNTQSCNVYWLVGSSATLSAYSTIVGNIIAVASITLNVNATLTGRAIALTGAVTMDTNNVTRCTCTTNPCT